jgi:hypothetical protein
VSATETETVSLNLDGDFAAKAEKDAAAAEKLGDALDKLGKPKEVGKGLDVVEQELKNIAALEAKIANFDAGRVRQASALKAQLKSMEDAALGKMPQHEENRSLFDGGAMAMSAGMAIERAGEKLLQAGVELAKDALEITAAADKFAIAQTSKKELQGAVFGKLGGNYEQTVQTALSLGINEDKAVAEAKTLLNAKFSKTEIPVLMKIAAGMDLVKEGSGGELLGKLEEIKLKPKVDAKEIKSLAAVGLDTKEVYAALAKQMGTSVPVAMAKVKAGTASSAEVIKAIETVADKSFGGMAEKAANSVPALFAHAKGDFERLFDDIDLGPFKDVLKNVIGVLEGPEGAALKGGIKDLLDSINHGFLDQFRGEEGKQKIRKFVTDAGAALHELAAVVRELKPVFDFLGDAATGSAEIIKDEFLGMKIVIGVLEDLADAMDEVSDPLTQLEDTAGNLSKATDDINLLSNALDRLNDALSALDVSPANDVGNQLDAGMADGIGSGASQAIDAAEQMADDALAAAKSALGVASPSKEFGELGGFSAEGYADELAAHPGPAQAGAAMAQSALGGAGGGGAAAVGSSSASSAGPTIISVTFAPVLSGGASAAENRRMLTELYPDFLAMTRRAIREAQEGRAA